MTVTVSPFTKPLEAPGGLIRQAEGLVQGCSRLHLPTPVLHATVLPGGFREHVPLGTIQVIALPGVFREHPEDVGFAEPISEGAEESEGRNWVDVGDGVG